MSNAPFDQRLANEALAVDQCMKLGAVVLKPSSQKPLGFSAATPPAAPADPSQLARELSFRRRTS